MKIIVLAHPKDDHAAPVCWALEQAGYQTACWSGVSPAQQEQASLVMDEHPSIRLGTHRLESDDVLWLRQSDSPADALSGAKAASPCSAFFDALICMLENLPVRCINRYSASRLVRNKAVQLRMAGASGLKTPATLMSNSPAAVRRFFDQYPDNAICKAFASHVWQQGSEDLTVTETFSLKREDLPADDEVFTYSPAIYQEKVKKHFDVRAVLMGERVYSFAVRTPANSLDWRHDAALRNAAVERIATPAAVESGILRFAAAAGVCTGSLDLAVDRNGEWWFLEINEQGQFLWLDDFCPQAQLLEKFCAFLTAPQSSRQTLGSPDHAGFARAVVETLEERQGLFPSIAEYQRSHQQEKALNIASVSADAPFKSVEP